MNKITKQELVYQEISDKIFSNEYKPGTVLTEEMLCTDLGVSRTPVREAIRRLATDGFLSVTPGTGMTVIQLKLDDMIEIYEMRDGLERIAIKLFMQKKDNNAIKALSDCYHRLENAYKEGNETEYMKCDMKFHKIIYVGARNQRLISSLDNIYRQISLLAVSVQTDKGLLDLAMKEHKKICEAVINDNLNAAIDAVEEHNERVKNYHLRQYYHL